MNDNITNSYQYHYLPTAPPLSHCGYVRQQVSLAVCSWKDLYIFTHYTNGQNKDVYLFLKPLSLHNAPASGAHSIICFTIVKYRACSMEIMQHLRRLTLSVSSTPSLDILILCFNFRIYFMNQTFEEEKRSKKPLNTSGPQNQYNKRYPGPSKYGLTKLSFGCYMYSARHPIKLHVRLSCQYNYYNHM